MNQTPSVSGISWGEGRSFASVTPDKPFALKDFLDNLGNTSEDWLLTLCEGNDHTPKVLRYDLKALVDTGGILTAFHFGTALRNVMVVRRIVVLALFAAACMLAILATFAGRWSDLASVNVQHLVQIVDQFDAILPFFMALFLAEVLYRWWAIRCSSIEKVHNSLFNVCWLVENELRSNRWFKVKEQVQKYSFAVLELLLQAATRQSDLPDLVRWDLLSAREAAFLETLPTLWQRPLVIWAWISAVSTQALLLNLSIPPVENAVVAQCVSANQGINLFNAYMDTQLPWAYVHMIAFFVSVHNLMVACKAGLMLAQHWAEGNYGVMILEGLGCLVVWWIYQSLLFIVAVLMEPLGSGQTGTFPMRAFHHFLATGIDAVAKAQQDCMVVADDGSLHCPWADPESEFTSEGDTPTPFASEEQ